MAISLSTSLCTSLATSLCGEDVPVIQANHLNVEYSISGTTSHLNFLRYPQSDVSLHFITINDDDSYTRDPDDDTTRPSVIMMDGVDDCYWRQPQYDSDGTLGGVPVHMYAWNYELASVSDCAFTLSENPSINDATYSFDGESLFVEMPEKVSYFAASSPAHAWINGDILWYTDVEIPIPEDTHVWDFNGDNWVDSTEMNGDTITDSYSEDYFAWKCCDTELISVLYSENVEELQLGDPLWKYEDGQIVQSDGVIETRDMSIWSDEFTVLVLDEITEANSDRVYIYVNGASYYNAYQSFVIAPARYGDTIRLYIHENSTYAPAWSDGSTARERYISINPSSYGYQITRVYPA